MSSIQGCGQVVRIDELRSPQNQRPTGSLVLGWDLSRDRVDLAGFDHSSYQFKRKGMAHMTAASFHGLGHTERVQDRLLRSFHGSLEELVDGLTVLCEHLHAARQPCLFVGNSMGRGESNDEISASMRCHGPGAS